MHELSVTESILEIALRHAQQANSNRVLALHLVIGQLSSIVDDSIQFYWDIISKDTPAEGARLEFTRLPARLRCQACELEYTPGEDLTCPDCHSARVRVVAGNEFRLESIEVE